MNMMMDMTAESAAIQQWLTAFYELSAPDRAGVIDYITQEPNDIGAGIASRLRELYDLPPDSQAAPMDDDVQRLADDFGVDPDACYQREDGFSYEEIAAWGAR